MGKSKDEKVDLDWSDGRQRPKIKEGLKKVFATGASALIMSEEIVKHYVQDMKLPKEMITAMTKSIGRSKEEILGRVGDEFSQLIQKIDIAEEMKSFLKENKVKFTVEVDFEPKDKNKKDS